MQSELSRGWRRVARMMGCILAAVALVTVAVPGTPAAAEGMPPEQAATETAAEVCATAPQWDLPEGVPDDMADTRKICEAATKQILLDPEKGAEAVCRVVYDSLPIPPPIKIILTSPPSVMACGKVVGEGTPAARAIYEEKIKPIADAVECAVSEDGVFCITQQVAALMGAAVTWTWDAFIGVVMRPTMSLDLLRSFQVAEGERTPQQDAFVSTYRDIGVVAACILMLMFLLQLIRATLSQEVAPLKTALGGLLTWAVMWVALVGVAGLWLALCDGMTELLAGAPDESGTRPIDQAGETFGQFVGAVTAPAALAPGGSTLLVIVVLLILVALAMAFITLAFRDVSLVIMGAAIPLLLAMRAGPDSLRAAAGKAAMAFFAIGMAKPLMVVALRLGSGLVGEPNVGSPDGVFTAFVGVTVIGIAAFCPAVIYKLFGVMQTAAGSKTGAGAAGMAQQLLQSARQGGGSKGVADAFRQNAPGGGAAGGATKALSAAGMVGKIAGLAAEGASSLGKAAASQVGTAGGATEDAEAPHVPQPGHGGRRGGPGGGPKGQNGPGTATSKTPPATKDGSGSGPKKTASPGKTGGASDTTAGGGGPKTPPPPQDASAAAGGGSEPSWTGEAESGWGTETPTGWGAPGEQVTGWGTDHPDPPPSQGGGSPSAASGGPEAGPSGWSSNPQSGWGTEKPTGWGSEKPTGWGSSSESGAAGGSSGSSGGGTTIPPPQNPPAPDEDRTRIRDEATKPPPAGDGPKPTPKTPPPDRPKRPDPSKKDTRKPSPKSPTPKRSVTKPGGWGSQPTSGWGSKPTSGWGSSSPPPPPRRSSGPRKPDKQ